MSQMIYSLVTVDGIISETMQVFDWVGKMFV